MTKKLSKLTNSEIGSKHWEATLLGRQIRFGEFLKEKTPNEETLRSWGQEMYEIAQEMIKNHKKTCGNKTFTLIMDEEEIRTETKGFSTIELMGALRLEEKRLFVKIMQSNQEKKEKRQCK